MLLTWLEGVFKRVGAKECHEQMCILEISFGPQCREGVRCGQTCSRDHPGISCGKRDKAYREPEVTGCSGDGEVDGVTRDGIVMARLDVQVKGAGVSKISSGLWLGITGDGIRGHELIQERNM